MRIAQRWYNNEETIVLMVFRPNWTLADMDLAFDKLNKRLERRSVPIAVIFDMRGINGAPGNVLHAFRRHHHHLHQNFAGAVFTGPSIYGRLIANVISRMPWGEHCYTYAEHRNIALDLCRQMLAKPCFEEQVG